MSTVILFAIFGLGSGAAYALTALGLVLIHRGSGTVNFAQGGIAMVGAYSYTHLVQNGVSEALALVIVLGCAAIFGVIWYVAVMRPLRNAPVLAKVVATLGLLAALEGVAQIWWGGALGYAASVFTTSYVKVFGIEFGQDRLWLLGTAVVISIALYVLYKFTLFGVSTRAAAENPRAASLLGFSPDLIAGINWAVGCVLAALAGVLIAPIIGLDIGTLTLLIVPGLAAALVGGFRSFWITTLAGVLIGCIGSELTRYWTQTGVVDALPFVLVIFAVVVTGRSIPERGRNATARLPLAPKLQVGIPTGLLLVGLAVVGSAFLDNVYKSAIATSLIAISAALSVVIITGFVGQISLMPMTFVGLGSYFTWIFAENLHVPFPLPILISAILLVPIGVLLGLPALRVRGLNLAVVTVGAAVTIYYVLFNNSVWTGGGLGSLVPSPSIFGLSLDPVLHPFSFGVFCIIVTAILVFAIQNLRRSPLGLRMLAVRSNERAAAMSGVNVAATKLQAFALSAVVASVSGSLLAYQIGAVPYSNFDVFSSISLIILVYIGGVSLVSGALFAGVGSAGGVFYLLVQQHVSFIATYYGFISGALLVLTVIANPDGVVIANRRQWLWIKEHFAHQTGSSERFNSKLS
jgi:branched-chain amino acid transport system permease protein